MATFVFCPECDERVPAKYSSRPRYVLCDCCDYGWKVYPDEYREERPRKKASRRAAPPPRPKKKSPRPDHLEDEAPSSPVIGLILLIVVALGEIFYLYAVNQRETAPLLGTIKGGVALALLALVLLRQDWARSLLLILAGEQAWEGFLVAFDHVRLFVFKDIPFGEVFWLHIFVAIALVICAALLDHKAVRDYTNWFRIVMDGGLLFLFSLPGVILLLLDWIMLAPWMAPFTCWLYFAWLRYGQSLRRE